jgi:hypothetical protein
MFSVAHWLLYSAVRCNSDYQVHVSYVGWATCSRATVKIRLYVFKQKKQKNKKKHGLSQQMVSEQLVLWFVRKAERENLGLCQSLIITKEP